MLAVTTIGRRREPQALWQDLHEALRARFHKILAEFLLIQSY